MGNGGIQLRISDLLFAVQKRWKIIVTLTFLGGVFGLLLSGLSYVQSSLTSYNVSGSMAINTQRPDGSYLFGDLAPSQNDFHLAEDMVDSVIYVMHSDRVLNEVINRVELLGVDYTDIRKGMNVSSYNGTQILEMTINWFNDEEGKAIWNAIVECANEVMPETLLVGHLSIINECTATLVGVGGSGRSVPILLAILGFAAGIGFALMELLMHPTLNNVKDIETVFGLETIGLIPRDEEYFKKKTSMLVKEEAAASFVSQNYSAAAFILRNRLGTKENHHCFYVTSATNQEGRTTVAANLAIQLSDMEHRTLLVDFDFKNPSLGALFMNNVDYEHSLNALYRGEINEQEAVTTLTGYLDILPAVLEHNSVPMDSMVIDLIRKLSERYEYIILDAPPVGTESETLSLNQLADTVLFVIGYDKASIPEIQGALDKLDKSGIRVLGCVVNNVQGTRYKAGEDKKDVKKHIRKAQEKKKTDQPSAIPDQKEPSEPILSSPEPQKDVKKQIRKAQEKRKTDQPSAVPDRKEPSESILSSPGPQKIIRQGVKKKNIKEESVPLPKLKSNAPPKENQGPRNVMEELSREEESSKRMNDQAVLAELYKMGMKSHKDKPDGDKR